MFFDGENFRLNLLHGARYSWDGSRKYVNPRHFSALAMRIAGKSSFDFDDGTHIETKAGDILYVPQNTGYFVDYSRGEIISLDFVAEGYGKKVEKFNSIDSAKFADLFSAVARLFGEQRNGYIMEATSILYKIFSELAKNKGAQMVYNPGFFAAISYIRENFKDPELSFPLVCKKCGISESVFRRCFRGAFGKTPVSYLTELRVQEAEQLLIGGNKTVEEAALECGFSDSKYFSRVVKKYRGVSPSLIKNSYR